jgi:ribosomal protein S25
MIFNKSVKTKKAFQKIKEKITSQLGYYKHPKDLTKEDKKWLIKNIKQFDEKILNKILDDGRKSDKPK